MEKLNRNHKEGQLRKESKLGLGIQGTLNYIFTF